jgi:protein kinase-like protein
VLKIGGNAASADVDELDRQQQLREARALARITHPNVVAVHDVGTIDGSVFVAMELVEGDSFDRWRERESRTTDDVLAVMRHAGAGLAAAHAAGLVHGDVKPSNILVTPAGRVVVIDFGLATTHMGHGGTPGYMAPEQSRHAVLDARADQYGFSVTLSEALCGQMPSRLRRALDRALQVDPRKRYPSMDALLQALHGTPRARWLRVAAVVAALIVAALVTLRLAAPSAPIANEERRGLWRNSLFVSAGSWLMFGGIENGALPPPTRAAQVVAKYVQERLGACASTHVAGERVSYQLRACEIELGPRVDGEMTVSYSYDGDRLVAQLAAPSLSANGGRARLVSRAELRQPSDDVALDVTLDGVGPRGVPYVWNWRAVVQRRTGGCELFDGSWRFEALATEWRGTFEALEVCRSSCPRARRLEYSAAGAPPIRIEWDGTRLARWSTADGRTGEFTMPCQPLD